MIDLNYTYDSKTRDLIIGTLEATQAALARAAQDAQFYRQWNRLAYFEAQSEAVQVTLDAIDKAEA